MNTRIIECNVSGVKSPRIYIQGLLCGNEKIVIRVDGKDIKYDDLDYIGRNVILKDYVETPEFRITANLPKNSKKVIIIAKKNDIEEIIKIFKVNIITRMVNKVLYIEKRNRLLIFSILKATKRIILISKQKKDFSFKKDKLKKYYKIWKYNIGRRVVESEFYIPEKQRDYLKWIEENNFKIEYKDFKYNPLISILIPVYNTDSYYLKECIDSVLNQSYKNFEICIADDNSTIEETINILHEYESIDERIKIVYRKENGNISKATNSALEIAKGEYIALLDNDDILAPNALYEIVLILNKDKNLDMIYTDEDKISLNGLRSCPNFKPDFSPDTLLSMNYICHFLILRKSIVNKLGGFRSQFDGAQDYDMILRYTEETDKIYHISKILYHWRESINSTSLNLKNKSYALEKGKLVLENTLKRRKINGKIKILEDIGRYQVEYQLDKEPKISIIIPTRNKANILNKCLMSIYEKTTYKNFEIIVIDNNSDEESLFDLLKNYKNKYNNFNSYRYECEFNYSYLNNEAAEKATGEYILLLNNDTEVITPDWLNIMVGYASQKHIGCVGVKLLYPNNNIQHAGVVIGMGGVASHTYINTPDEENGYFDRLIVPYDVKMVTAACLMIKKNIFKDIKGLDEKLKVAYNDVDLNIRVRNEGYYNVLLPQVKLYHYESLSRGSDFEDSKKERFRNEIKYIVNKLGKYLIRDEFYNDNLSNEYWFVLDRKVK